MGIWNKITSFFKKDKQVAALPSAQGDYDKRQRSCYSVYRADGTQLQIWPRLDRLGNQEYEPVFNCRTNQMQYIPKFDIYANELTELLDPQIMSTSVLIDMDPKLLNDPECLDWVANHMLSRERMPKVIRKYNNYVGVLQKVSNSESKFDKKIDEGIILSLSQTREQKKRMLRESMRQRQMEERQEMYEKAQNHSYHVKDSHAEDLSQIPYPYDNYSR